MPPLVMFKFLMHIFKLTIKVEMFDECVKHRSGSIMPMMGMRSKKETKEPTVPKLSLVYNDINPNTCLRHIGE